ncbi:MAG: hypothetical protein WC847_02655 [Candidatus Paceibacterota bacterium]
MNIEDNFPPRQFKIDSDLDPEEALTEAREQEEKLRSEQEGRDLVHSQIEIERLSRPQNIIIKLTQLNILKKNGEVELDGIDFRGRDIKQGEKVILFGRNEKIEAKFDGIVKKNKDGTMTIKVSSLN